MSAGMSGDLSQFMNQLGPTEEEKRQARAQAALMAGLGMLGARPRYLAQDLSRAAQSGIVDYNQQMRDSGEDKMKRIAVAQQMQQMLAQRQQAAEQQAAMGAMRDMPTGGNTLTGAPQPFQGERTLPTQTAPQQLDPVAKMINDAQYMIDWGRKNGNATAMKQGQAMLESAVKQREEFGQPQVDIVGGKPVMRRYGKYGGEQTVSGAEPVPKLREVNTGGDIRMLNDYNIAPGTVIPKTMTYGERTQAANQNLAERRFTWDKEQVTKKETAVPGFDPKVTMDVRKEFNALPQVKMWMEVQPVLQSARQAASVDNKAANLNLVYAVAKAMDPIGVVRESDSNMVIATGSPANQLKGMWDFVVSGRGTLTAEVRKNLMEQLESRAAGHEANYRAARKTYEPLVKKLGAAPEDVFIEPFVGNDPLRIR